MLQQAHNTGQDHGHGRYARYIVLSNCTEHSSMQAWKYVYTASVTDYHTHYPCCSNLTTLNSISNPGACKILLYISPLTRSGMSGKLSGFNCRTGLCAKLHSIRTVHDAASCAWGTSCLLPGKEDAAAFHGEGPENAASACPACACKHNYGMGLLQTVSAMTVLAGDWQRLYLP